MFQITGKPVYSSTMVAADPKPPEANLKSREVIINYPELWFTNMSTD